jgi:DNA-binding FadR family transcriptional regulator
MVQAPAHEPLGRAGSDEDADGQGLVTARPKVGTRVEPREHWNLLDRDVLVWYIAAPDRERFLRSVQEMRRIFEPEAAAMAALHRSAEQMASITAACQSMGTATTVESRIEADVRFHLAVLHAAGNEFLVPFGSLIESALATVFDFATRRAGTRHAQSLHEDIEIAIRRQRPDAARRAVLRLLADTDDVISQAGATPQRRAGARQRRAAG